jgi:hypothetical protein
MDAENSPEMFVPTHQSTGYHQKKATSFDWSCLRREFNTKKEAIEDSRKLRSYGCHNLYFLLITTVTKLRRKKHAWHVTYT